MKKNYIKVKKKISQIILYISFILREILNKNKKYINEKVRLLLFINIIILICNICLFYKTNIIIIIQSNNNNNFLINFRKIDNFPLKLISKTYKEISDYLTNKFYIKNDKLLFNSNNKQNNKIKTIKILYVDLHRRFINLIKEDLKGIINIKIDKKNPDYLLYSTHGCKCIDEKYKNTIKLAFFTENQIPDLDFADYAVGLSHISYLDRFFTFPYFIYHLYINNINFKNITLASDNAIKYHNRTKFCGAVITNWQGKLRIGFIQELSKYKTVDMGGRYLNNIGGNVENKIEFLSSYKFSISMENSEGDGYVTEKIIDSFMAGTIPIYFGDYTIDEYINPKSYILIRNRKDIKEKIEYIKKIDNDDELYKSILKEKVFNDDKFLEKIKNSRKNFLLNIFQQNKELAKRIDNYHFNISNHF